MTPLVQEWVDLIGFELSIRLLTEFGGRLVYVPLTEKGLDNRFRREARAMVGDRPFEKMVATYKGESILLASSG
ncbi:hypothetical protein [Caballeronia sp. LZ003]|uniref:hypothetical protein n=1 Tax=Caballeronia sp. LZ003 TaxID=3038559 RepID=UPI002855226F|nr:hypothetical protein [Caballeronia sp. LZ003]MDR5777185.1 hypothetical protein [Caballeronia sp. LZ002]MDR5852590.1 hypothetical protein [Caballeronia sp. LZ003]